jgi:TonB family protein
LQQTKQVAHLLAAQLDVSYRGDLAQWRAALHRRALLPSALAQTQLEKTSAWTLQTPRFVSGVAPELLSLTDKSPLSLTMGFMGDGPQTVWDIQGVTWDQDDRKDAGVELWRRMRPPGDAKLELRNRFDSIRQRRAPYDGSLSRDTVDTYSATSVLDVPGRKAGAVSADLVYGVTVHLVGRPSSADVAASLARAAGGTRVLEHGVGEDLAQGQKPMAAPRADSPDALLDDFERRISDRGPEVDRFVGKDIRGRQMTEDLHEFVRTARREWAGLAAKNSGTDEAAWVSQQTERFGWLQAYWSEYPALTHNRDMFADFLARNHMQPTTSHGPQVVKAESELREALRSAQPTEEWAKDARALCEAYIEERSAFVKNSRGAVPATVVFSPRSSPCPAAATTTTGTAHPRVGAYSASLLDYWPMESRRLGEQGTVMAALRISAAGCATGKAIVGSSGSDMLDGAVLEYLETIEFIPAGSDGKAVQSEVTVPVVFKLQQ